MKNKLILGIDQGSSSSKAVLCTLQGEAIEHFYQQVTSFYPDHDKVEQDPNELYQSIIEIIEQAKVRANQIKADIAAIGFSFQRSGVTAWNKSTNKTLHPLISWRDNRGQSKLDQLEPSDLEQVRSLTSLQVLAGYAASKIGFLQNEFPDSDTLVGTLDTYVMHRLSKGSVFYTEDGMASRTMLYSYDLNNWNDHLCNIFSVNQQRLASIQASLGPICSYTNIPVLTSLGDKQASILVDAPTTGNLSINIGSTTSIAIHTSEMRKAKGFLTSALLSTVGTDSRNLEFMLEGIFNSSGATLDYIKQHWGTDNLFEKLAKDYPKYAQQELPLAFLPFRGTGTPEWRNDLPFIISDDKAYSQDQVLQALVEYLGFGIAQVLDHSRDIGLLPQELPRIIASGGLSKLKPLVQMIANCTKLPISISEQVESSAYGAALAAARVLTQSSNLTWLPSSIKTCNPVAQNCQQKRYQDWKELRQLLHKEPQLPKGYKLLNH